MAKRKIVKSGRAGTVSLADIARSVVKTMAKKKAETLKRTYWVSRDEQGCDKTYIYLWPSHKPKWYPRRKEWGVHDPTWSQRLDSEEFEDWFGWCPKPGECWQITEIWTDE